MEYDTARQREEGVQCGTGVGRGGNVEMDATIRLKGGVNRKWEHLVTRSVRSFPDGDNLDERL